MSAFRQAALRALAGMPIDAQAQAAQFERITIEVTLGAEREMVSLSLRDGELLRSCTCGKSPCSHASAALTLLGQGHEPAVADRVTEVYLPAVAASAERRSLALQGGGDADRAALAPILEDLIVAVLRSGASVEPSASVADVLSRLVRAAPSQMPLGISRFIGRFRSAGAAADAGELVRVLSGADRLIDDLPAKAPSAEAKQRICAFLTHGPDGASAALNDVVLVEVARELLDGATRAAIERRYLVDPRDGRIYREERAGAAQDASLGPCPRLLTVSLASVESGVPPPRIRLYQYTITPAIEEQTWSLLAKHATGEFSAVEAAYRDALMAFPGLCEPFALLAPARIHFDAAPALIDGTGRALPILANEGASGLRFIERFCQGAKPVWFAGRVVDRSGTLALLVLSAAVEREGRVCYAQV